MIPCLTLTDEREEMDAQHLVCRSLVRACRQAIYELATEDEAAPDIRHRAVAVLKVVHQDWLEAQKAIARELRSRKALASSPSVAPIARPTNVRSGVE